MGDDGAKAAAAATGMKQITRLRELLHKWQTAMAMGSKQPAPQDDEEEDHGVAPDDDAVASAIPPFVLRRLRRAETADSLLSDDESCHSPEPPPDVPRGYCPVYVGPEQRRFVIPTSYLAHPVFRLLLEKAEEEFGFRHQGALAIPCETEAFKYILQCVQRHDNGLAAGDDPAADASIRRRRHHYLPSPISDHGIKLKSSGWRPLASELTARYGRHHHHIQSHPWWPNLRPYVSRRRGSLGSKARKTPSAPPGTVSLAHRRGGTVLAATVRAGGEGDTAPPPAAGALPRDTVRPIRVHPPENFCPWFGPAT
ncbi:hypothetical protein U9M48_014498 [Paspalum notatum var. saurae]|uniref:SAUR family protein n=1 Tax=Paspalum notatum var. saurae TaxID=547442 RepID=A0AAQ3T2X5_PASNO